MGSKHRNLQCEGGREGIEVARWLQTVCRSPIVFLTGYTDADTIDRLYERVPGAAVLSRNGLSRQPCRRRGSSRTAPSLSREHGKLIIIVVLLLLFGGGWYGRGRWH